MFTTIDPVGKLQWVGMSMVLTEDSWFTAIGEYRLRVGMCDGGKWWWDVDKLGSGTAENRDAAMLAAEAYVFDDAKGVVAKMWGTEERADV